jgi:hypothetical protein
MSVYIACDKCDKRLKIPDEVVGRAIKCPVCGSVFKATPENVLPAKAAAVVPTRSAPAVLDDEDDDRPKPRKKAVATEDEEAIVSARKRHGVAADEDQPASTARGDADEPAEVEDVEEEPRKGKRRTPWYVMLPLLVLSLSGAGLAALWTIGFSYLDLDRGLKHLNFDNKVIIGVAAAGTVVLLCLIVTLIPVRAWLRFLLVLLFLGLGYGGSFAAIHWWDQLPIPDEEKPAPLTTPLPPLDGGGPGRGAPPGGGEKQGPQE